MSDEQSTKVSPIAVFIPGGRRTPLSASVMNEMVGAINALLMLSGSPGIKVFRADAGFKIELDEAYVKKLVAQVEPGTGTLNWKGAWSSVAAYAVGDIVIRPLAANMEDGKAGTFVCVEAHTNEEPPSGNAQDNTHWARLARACWDRFLVNDFGTPANGNSDFLGGRCMLTLDNNDPPTRIDLGRVTRPAEMIGLTLVPELWHVCDPDTGEAVQKIVIAATVPEE